MSDADGEKKGKRGWWILLVVVLVVSVITMGVYRGQKSALHTVRALFVQAAFDGNLQTIQKLLPGADLEWVDDSDMTENYYPGHGDTALVAAVSDPGGGAKNLRVVQLLLEHGANVNSQRSLVNKTALMEASCNGTPEIVKLLLDHGADISLRDDIENTALLCTSPDIGLPQAYHSSNSAGITKLLLQHGADPNTQNKYGQTALILECQRVSAYEDVKLLLDAGANVNAKDKIGSGRTPLSTALSRDLHLLEHPLDGVVELLLTRGADAKAPGLVDLIPKNTEPETRAKLVAMLKRAGA